MNFNHIIKILSFLGFFIFLLLPLVSCSTGIESTKKISLSKEDKRELTPSPEDVVMSDIKGIPLSEWQAGMPFLVTDDRAAIIFNISPLPDQNSINGKIVRYVESGSRITPGGNAETVIRFSDGHSNYEYATGKDVESALRLTSLDIPMLIDLSLVDKAREKLSGMKVWTKSGLWYDRNGEKINGLKFVPVTIVDVAPGDVVFPLKLTIADSDDKKALLYMNFENRGLESRTFADIFSISDPKSKYPNIRKEVWELITRSKVAIGMTKEECKLALGNPEDVNSGHDWNRTIDLWRYSNGAYLQFQDGILSSFRI